MSVRILMHLCLFLSTIAWAQDSVPLFDDCAEYLMRDVLQYYQQNNKKSFQLKVSDVNLSSDGALDRVREAVPVEAYTLKHGTFELRNGWSERLTDSQHKLINDYLAIRAGRKKELRFLNRDTVLVKEYVEHLLSKDVKLTLNEFEIAFDVTASLDAMTPTQLKLLFEFQKMLAAVEKNPLDYKRIFDVFLGRVDIARASLGARGKLVPKAYKDFFALHAYKNPRTGAAMPGWKLKHLDDSGFVIPGGKRTSYRGPEGIVIVENHNAESVLETVEVIVERSLTGPEKGVAFFAYKIGNKSNLGELSETNVLHFRGKEATLRVNTSNGCVSCHKLLDAVDFTKSTSSVHPFSARTVIPDAIAEDMYPSSRRLQQLMPGAGE